MPLQSRPPRKLLLPSVFYQRGNRGGAVGTLATRVRRFAGGANTGLGGWAGEVRSVSNNHHLVARLCVTIATPSRLYCIINNHREQQSRLGVLLEGRK